MNIGFAGWPTIRIVLYHYFKEPFLVSFYTTKVQQFTDICKYIYMLYNIYTYILEICCITYTKFLRIHEFRRTFAPALG